MDRFLQDVRFGIRSLLNASRFTIAAVPALTLGIGSQNQANGHGNLYSTQKFRVGKRKVGSRASSLRCGIGFLRR